MRKRLIALLVITPLLLSSQIQTSVASDGHTENFCKNIEFSSKLSKKKCQDVVFMEDKAKTVNFCQVAVSYTHLTLPTSDLV